MNNYIVYHLHSDFSNAFTIMDSVTKYDMYINKAKDLNMKALAFSEHGNTMSWYYKKKKIEELGMKYIHAVEIYVTENLSEIKRDNYHCVLIAKNYNGVKELNRLVSKSFDRKDKHFYYVPRITFDELKNTSDNIIITTACLGGILNSDNKNLKIDFINFLTKNKHRSFLEIQHHNIDEQIKFNKLLFEIHKKTNIPLIAGTDTHSLNNMYEDGRKIMQKSKNIKFDNENNWDLTFKSFDDLLYSYNEQNSLPKEVYLKAISNTNILYDIIEDFELDLNTKYPKIYNEPKNVFINKIKDAIPKNIYLKERYTDDEIFKRIRDEFYVYEKTNTFDYMLLQNYLREWERQNNIFCGYSRGSVSGSMISYILGVTEIDSMKFDLNFFRFLNPDRISNADIDTDYYDEDRLKVKNFLLKDKLNLPNINTSEIVTFNTIAKKGAIRDVGRALNIDLNIIDSISKNIEENENDYRDYYPDLFKYVDLLQGVIVSIGTHPAGVLITDNNILEDIGICTLKTTDNQVSMLNMKELDDLMYVKLDILGLDNIGIINETCKLANINRKTPDNIDLNDMEVWKSIRNDTTLIFQWESSSAQKYLKVFMSDETISKAKKLNSSFSMLKWFSFGNGLIRPACESFRYDVAKGEFYDNGLNELNEFLKPTLGYIAMQEDIMQFLVEFCGYSQAESDNVRRAIGKKKNTEELLPEIEDRFIKHTFDKFKINKDKSKEVIKPFLQVILDATSYAFSWNHADSYSCIGYICGWLRYYYPLEFLSVALNINSDKKEKTAKIIEYANKIGIKIENIKFRKSIDRYTFDKDTNTIYKGIESVKFCNSTIALDLHILKDNKYNNFVDLLIDIKNSTSVNSRQLEILTVLNYFSEFGKNKKLLQIIEIFDKIYNRKQFNKKDLNNDELKEIGLTEELLSKYSGNITKVLYKDLDTYSIIQELTCSIPNKILNLKEQLNKELEYLEYCITVVPEAKGFMFVKDFKVYNDACKPYFTLYNTETGEEIKTKVTNSDNYIDNPFIQGNLLEVFKFETKNKKKQINGKWQVTNEVEQILTEWEVY